MFIIKGGRKQDCQSSTKNQRDKETYLGGQWYEFLKEDRLRK